MKQITTPKKIETFLRNLNEAQAAFNRAFPLGIGERDDLRLCFEMLRRYGVANHEYFLKAMEPTPTAQPLSE